MPCFHPIPAAQAKPGDQVQLHPPCGGETLSLPCGKCLGCRVSKAQEWATRIMHERQFHRHNQFITLTYDDEHLPNELEPDDLRLFIKRLRREARGGHPELLGTQLRYFGAGEYGEITERPHYHLCLFGLGFRDETRYSDKLLTSPTLTEIWGMGHVRYGSLTHESAAYVAGYAGHKRVADGLYWDSNGEVKRAPFMRCSNRPGIGARYADRFSGDLAHGHVFAGGKLRHPPRYYRTRLKVTAPDSGEECAFNIWKKTQALDPQHRTAQGLTAKLVVLQQRHAAMQRKL